MHEAICHFSTCCAPSTNNIELWCTLKFLCMCFSPPSFFPRSFYCKQTNYAVHPTCVCVSQKFFINSSLWTPHPGSLGSCTGVEEIRPYRGSGSKPREVLLFLMCCRSPTQPPFPPPPPPTITIILPTHPWLELLLIILSVQQHTHLLSLSPWPHHHHHHSYTWCKKKTNK